MQKDLASDFCQANILKYGSRYGDKDGKNKKDLLKVIHYAMLLLHFDDHYKVTKSDFLIDNETSQLYETLSDKTISLLKNFSSINQSILVKEGNKLRTISVMKNILAEATVTEEFSKDFGVYDLNQFLNNFSLHQSPELDFKNDGYVVIREGKMRSKYFFADPNVIVTPPEKDITLPSEDVCFEISTEQLDKLLKERLSINFLISLPLVRVV